MQLRFLVDTDRLTFDDLIALENAKASDVKRVMCTCLVDAEDKFYPAKEAEKIIGTIPLSQLQEATQKFGEAMEAFKNKAIPPNGGNKSS